MNQAPHGYGNMKQWPRWGKRLSIVIGLVLILWVGVVWVLPWQAVVTGQVQRMVAGMPLQVEIEGEPRLRPGLTGMVVLLDAVQVHPTGMKATVMAHRPEVFLTWWRLLRWGGAGVEVTIPKVEIKVGNSLTVMEDMGVALTRQAVDQLAVVGAYRWAERRYRYDMALKFFPEHRALQFAVTASPFVGRAIAVRLVGAALWQGSVIVAKLSEGVFPGGAVTGTLRLEDSNDIVLIDGSLHYKNDQMISTKEKGFFEFRDAMAMAEFLSGAALSGRVRVGIDMPPLKDASLEIQMRPDQPLLVIGQGRAPQGEITARAVVEGGLDQWQVRDASLILGTEEITISAVKKDKATSVTVVGQGWKTWPIPDAEPVGIWQRLRDAADPVTVHFHFNDTILAGRSLALIRGTATLGLRRFEVNPLVVVDKNGEDRIQGYIGVDVDRLVPKVAARMEGEASVLAALLGGSLPLALGQGNVLAEMQGSLPQVPVSLMWTNEASQTTIKGTLDVGRSQPTFSGMLAAQRSMAPILSLQGSVQITSEGIQIGSVQGTIEGQPLHLDINMPWTVDKPLVISGTAGRLSARDVAGLLPISAPVAGTKCPALAGETVTTIPLNSLLVSKPWQVSLRLAEMSGVRMWRNVIMEGGGTEKGINFNIKANYDKGLVESSVRLNPSAQGGVPQLVVALRLRNIPAEVGVGRATLSGAVTLTGAATCLADMLDIGVGKIALTAQGVAVRGLALQNLLSLMRNNQKSGDGALILGDAEMSGRLASGRLDVNNLTGHFTGGVLAASGQYQIRDGLINGRAALRFAAYPEAPPLALDFSGRWNAPRVSLADKKFAVFLLQRGILMRENAFLR